MSLDTARPFRLDIDQDHVRGELDVIFQMAAPTDLLDLYVHGIRTDGTRTVSASIGDHFVMYLTVVTPEQCAELEQRAAEYNADTNAGWDALLARLAGEHLGHVHIPDTTARAPFGLLSFDSLVQFEELPAAAPLIQEKTDVGYRVEMPLPNGFIRLYLGQDNPASEVEWFNANPEQGLAYLWASALAQRATQRQKSLEILAAEQIRDIRAIEKALYKAVRA